MSLILCNTFFSVRTGLFVTLLLSLTYGALNLAESRKHKATWSAEELASQIGLHRDDMDWVPHLLKGGGYLVRDSQGNLLSPQRNEPN